MKSSAALLAMALLCASLMGIGACSANVEPNDNASTSDASAPSVATAQPASPFVPAPADTSRVVVQRGPRVELARAESSLPLAQLPDVGEEEEDEENEHEVMRLPRTSSAPANRRPHYDPVRQSGVPRQSMPVKLLDFAGQGHATSPSTQTGTPPDTNGAVGPNHYVQVVNGGIEVWNKQGGVVAASKLVKALWTNYQGTNAGNGCSTRNDGDPVVLYDQLADRWFITQFSLPNQSRRQGPSFQCVAVSQTGDPTGAYWLYDFRYATGVNDYGKFGVWPDAYYATFNLYASGTTFSGVDLCAYDRKSMLSGAPATQQCFLQAYTAGQPCPAPQPFTIFGVQPINLDGPIAPPIGTEGFFVQFDYSACTGPFNQLDMWKMHVDWTTPASSTLTGPTVLNVADFTPTCDFNQGNHCVPEPGNVTLDAIDDRVMFRFTYRNFGTHESLLLNHSVVGGAGSGIRWYEIRSPRANAPVVYQQGTYAPSDSLWRWMGSIAQDQARNFALGYSVSSTSQDPSIAWTGRLQGDALGQMGQMETIIDLGTGVENDDYPPQRRGRWGDYSNMSIDPTDDCTFWFTTELFRTSGTSSWDTQIASVKFPTCAANDFSMSIAPTSQTVARGGTTTYTVTTARTAGTPESIVLNIQDLPAGVTAAFVPPTVTAGTSSTLRLTAASNATLGTVKFTVIGTAPSAVHQAKADVTVNGACVPTTTCPPGQDCGTAPDGCGGLVQCGSCTPPQTCGGGGTLNKCGCTPITTCGGALSCGTIPNRCGGMLSCGTCATNQTCVANVCVNNTSDAGTDAGIDAAADSGGVDSGGVDSGADSGGVDSGGVDSSAGDSSIADSSAGDSSVADSSAGDSSIADSSAIDAGTSDSASSSDSAVVADTGIGGGNGDASDAGDAGEEPSPGSLCGGGCGCRTVEAQTSSSPALLGFGAIALFAMRRRRR